jgi:hypothetical protein
MYILLLYLTFVIDKKNVKEMASKGFNMITAIACSKAFCEFVIPAIVVLVLLLLMRFSSGANGRAMHKSKSIAVSKAKRNPYPVCGAVLNGLAGGGALTIYILEGNEHESESWAILCGTVAGIAASFVSLSTALILERFHSSRAIASGIVYLYVVLSTFGFGWMATRNMSFMRQLIITICSMIVLLASTSYAYWPPTIGRGGPKTVDVGRAQFYLFSIHRVRFLLLLGSSRACLQLGSWMGH